MRAGDASDYYPRQNCEFLRHQAKQKFDKIRSTMIECGKWASPHRIKWLLSQTDGERNNAHIVDPTHIIALRSYVAGFLEGNTSASRPWYRTGTADPDVNADPTNHKWLDGFTRRTLQVLGTSNFYHAAGQFYYDYGCFNTGAHCIEELDSGPYFHTLVPGSYYLINNGYGEAVVMVREFQLTVKALVDTYGKKKPKGGWDWSNFSPGVKKMYDNGIYTEMIDVVHVMHRNDKFDSEKPQVLLNKEWISMTYETGQGRVDSSGNERTVEGGAGFMDVHDKNGVYLNMVASRRKPFIVGKADSSNNFEYGEKGPTLDALGLIKSLQKKAIGKDQAMELMLRPPTQGPANLRKSYIAQGPGAFVPLDATAMAQKGLRSIYEVNPAVATINADVVDLRQMVDKLYYADFLLYLSKNPKTRTATETNAILQEQQLVIGPNLQSLNWTYNVPVIDFVMDYVLYDDPWIVENPIPEDLQGKFLRPQFISIFAQAQNAADLPSIERYLAFINNVGAIDQSIFQKANLDKIADIYEDRLFLPAGINREQGQVDAMREAAQAAAEQRQMMTEQLPAMAGAAKDVGLKLA